MVLPFVGEGHEQTQDGDTGWSRDMGKGLWLWLTCAKTGPAVKNCSPQVTHSRARMPLWLNHP